MSKTTETKIFKRLTAVMSAWRLHMDEQEDCISSLPRERLFERLAEYACEGRLVFFIGAGFSKAVVGQYNKGPLCGQDRALSWIDLLREVAKHFDIDDVIPSADCDNCDKSIDCPQIASKMANSLQQKKPEIELENCEKQIKEYVCELTDWYPDKDQKIGWKEIFDAIRPSAIITTNYDHVLEELLEDEAISFSSTDTLPSSFEEKFLIYHIHGVRNRPDDLVLTRQDYIKALRPFSYRQVRLATLLRENSVLYLGYDKNDINILSAIDTAQEAFSDIKKKIQKNIHVQVIFDKKEDSEQANCEFCSEPIQSFSIKSTDIKNFLSCLVEVCNNKRDQTQKEYDDSIKKIEALLSADYSTGIPKEANQRHSDIVNAFENHVRLLNTPTRLGRLLASTFDERIKAYYRELGRQSHQKDNWQRYADMWAVLYAYFLMFSPMYAPKTNDVFIKPNPYTRRFKYAIGWFNDLAWWIGEGRGKSHPAWIWFKADWPKLSPEIRRLIASSAQRKEYENIGELLKRAGFISDTDKNAICSSCRRNW